MSDTPEFVELIDRLRALLDAEYRRGKTDASRRIMEAARVEAGPASVPKQDMESPRMNGAERPESSGRRASPGVPDALVTRVLMERGSQGASSREIEALAQSDQERVVSQSGIRFALERGRSRGRYRNERGMWFLVEETRN